MRYAWIYTMGLLSALGAAAAPAASPTLVLRNQVIVQSRMLRLGDLVALDDLSAEQVHRLNALAFGQSPMLGQVLTVERGAVQRQLIAAGLDLKVVGAPMAQVRRAAQQVTAGSLCDAVLAVTHVRASALPSQSQFGVRCAEGLGSVEVGAGALVLRAQPPELLDGRRQAPVELVIEGRTERVVRVPMEVNLQAMQWCATGGVQAGEPVSDSHFTGCRRPLQRTEEWRLADQPLPAGRLKRALRAGDVLTASDVADSAMQMKGDAVTVALRSGALVIESRGQLGRDARVGDMVRVHLAGGDWVTGRLAGAGKVDMEQQR